MRDMKRAAKTVLKPLVWPTKVVENWPAMVAGRSFGKCRFNSCCFEDIPGPSGRSGTMKGNIK
jgi:hypothetical protein